MQYDSSDAFVSAIAMATPPGVQGRTTAFWANGVLFRYYNYQPSETLAKEHACGNLLWDHIDFAPMPKYQKEIQAQDRPLVTVYVLDVSKHTLFAPFSKWVRDNLLEKKT